MDSTSKQPKKKDWDDDIDESENLYSFPFPETAADILSNPVKRHKNVAETKRSYSRMSLRPIIRFGEIEKPEIDSQSNIPSAGRKAKSAGGKAKVSSPLFDKKTKPVYGIDLNMKRGSSELFISKFSEEKRGRGKKMEKSVKKESLVGYLRTRKNLKRKIEEEKSISDDIITSEPSPKMIADKQKKSDELKIDLEEVSEESDHYSNSSDQPPSLVQKNEWKDILERYLQLKKANPKEEDESEPEKPVGKSNSDKKLGSVSKKSPIEKKTLLSPSIDQPKSEELHEEFFANIKMEDNGSSNLIPSRNKEVSHMSDMTVNSTEEKEISFNFGDTSFSGKNSAAGSGLSRATATQENKRVFHSVSSHVQGTSTENSVYTVKSIISEENINQISEPDFEITHQTRSLQSADFLCAYIDELNALKNGSELDDETTPAGDMTVRQFYSIPNVNDAYSEILSGFSELDDLIQPTLCFELPADFLDKSYSQMVTEYVEWIMKKIMTCESHVKERLFSCKNLLNFAYQHLSNRECALLTMVFNDPKEQLSISEITSKFIFVAMVVIFNSFIKEACSY